MIRIPPVAVIDSEVHFGVVLQRHHAGSSAVVSLLTSCLFGIHTSLKTPLILIWQNHEPEICCQLSNLSKLLYHLKGGRLDRNGLGIYILLLPNLPVSPFASSQPCPCCCYCLNGDSVLKLLLCLPEKKQHPWSQQTGDKREGQVGCSLELKKKERVIIKQTSSLLQPWSFLGPF